MARGKPEIDHRLVKAIGHPLRMRLLAALNERVASPSELSEHFGEPLGVVAYHIKILDELGCLELVRETPRRGAVEHHYRAVVRPYFSDEAWAELPDSVKRSISQGTLTEIWRDIGNAVDADTFDSHEYRHLLWDNLTLDDRGWAELNKCLTRVYEEALAIQARSLQRLAKSGGDPLPTSKLVLIHYEAAPAQKKGGTRKASRRVARRKT